MSPQKLKMAFLHRHLQYLSLIFCLSLASQICSGQQELLSPQASAASKSIDWELGPKNVKLGAVAEINVPAGYKFLNGTDASMMLQRAGNPDTDGLVGILAPVSEKWFGVIRYADIGYVNDSDRNRLDAKALLENFRNTMASQSPLLAMSASPTVGMLEWEQKPAYDTSVNAMEWATKAGPTGRAVVNYAANLLGRHGVVNFVAFETFHPGMDLEPLRNAARTISFVSGERYADHQPADKDAHTNLAGVAAGGESSDPGAQPGNRHANFLWIGIFAGLAIVSGLAGVIVMAKKSSRRHARHSPVSQRPVLAVETVHPGPEAVLAATDPGSKPASANGQALTNGTNGHSDHRNGKHGERKRKKHFSFYAFHSDMVMNLTRSCYEGGYGSFPNNGQSALTEENGATVEGQSSSELPAPGGGANLLAHEISNLIASQQKLIEGQRRFIEEQHKLIQEKNKLIEAENRMLEKQSELIEGQHLL